MRSSRDLFLRAKRGQPISSAELISLKRKFFCPEQEPEYHDILAFGILVDPDTDAVKQLISTANRAFQKGEDELLQASLVVGCNYWDSAEHFLDLSVEILLSATINSFIDCADSAAYCVSRVAMKRKSNDLLGVLIDAAERYKFHGEAEMASEIERIALKAATGERWTTREESGRFFLSKDAK